MGSQTPILGGKYLWWVKPIVVSAANSLLDSKLLEAEAGSFRSFFFLFY